MNIIGKVQQIDPKTTSFGTMYNLKVDGKWYGNGKVSPLCSVGDQVKFTTVQRGQYTNIKDSNIEILQAGPGDVPQTQQSSSGQPDWNNRQKRIEYQNSRGVAAQLTDVVTRVDTKTAWDADAVLALHNDLTWRLMQDMENLDEELALREANTDE